MHKHLLLIAGAFAVGYFAAGTLSAYQPFKYAAQVGTNLAS